MLDINDIINEKGVIVCEAAPMTSLRTDIIIFKYTGIPYGVQNNGILRQVNFIS